ncbi:uncharacterized protein LOC110659857 [Hevea brasiliensis]|uniref:uncharacterized protein LOC110659857 n=1 Tax=Hevea brasiliensis TaxID=3981 RepID=UPI0025EFDB3D|nr:uncharacterized protein LOC110659857 [Hevea brasiliensis]
MAPFDALHGYSPSFLPLIPVDSPTVGAVDTLLQERQQLDKLLRENLLLAQNRMKQQVDKQRSKRQFDVGEWVYLKLQPYRQASVSVRHSLKLSPKYYGPYQIIAKYGTVAYKLLLPPTSSIHPVFHFSMLKKKLGNNVTPLVDLPTMNEEQVVVALEQVLQTRTITTD